MATPDYKHMTVDLMIPGGNPDGSAAPAVGSVVLVSTDRDVDVKGVGRIAAKNAVRQYIIGRDGDFPVFDAIPSLDDALQDWSKGFYYEIRVLPGVAYAGQGVVGGPWKVVVGKGDPDQIRLTDYQGGRVVPAQEVDWQALIDMWSQTTSDSAAAVTAAEHAEQVAQQALDTAETAAAGPDEQVAGYLGDTSSQTRQAADALYVPKGATAWSTAALTESDNIDSFGQHSTPGPGAPTGGYGLRVVGGDTVEFLAGFTYTGGSLSGNSFGNFPDTLIGTISLAPFRPWLRSVDLWFIQSGYTGYFGRIDTDGSIILTAGTSANAVLNPGTALRVHATWEKVAD